MAHKMFVHNCRVTTRAIHLLNCKLYYVILPIKIQ